LDAVFLVGDFGHAPLLVFAAMGLAMEREFFLSWLFC
jgi:hypothetical protein